MLRVLDCPLYDILQLIVAPVCLFQIPTNTVENKIFFSNVPTNVGSLTNAEKSSTEYGYLVQYWIEIGQD